MSRWFLGNRIAISRADAMKPPPQVCIRCGASAAHVVRESYQTRNLAGLVPRIFPILVPYCPKHYRAYSRWIVSTWATLGAMLCPLLLQWLRPGYLGDLGISIPPNLVTSAFFVAGTVLIFSLYLVMVGVVRFVSYDAEYIEARGVSAEYILGMRQLQAKRLDGDVP